MLGLQLDIVQVMLRLREKISSQIQIEHLDETRERGMRMLRKLEIRLEHLLRYEPSLYSRHEDERVDMGTWDM